MHRVQRWGTSTLELRRDRYGNRKPSGGTFDAHCDTCGWSMHLTHGGHDREMVEATLDVAIKGHVDGAALQTPNAGHPFFQEIKPVPVKYVKKAQEFQAVQWKGDNISDFTESGYWAVKHVDSLLTGKAGHHVMMLKVGDWILKTPEGQLVHLTDEQFQQEFEEKRPQPRPFEYPVC